MLNAVAHVCVDFAAVVYPCDTEFDDTIRYAEPLNEIGFLEFRVFVILFLNCRKNLTYCLNVLRFVWKSSFEFLYDLRCVLNLFSF